MFRSYLGPSQSDAESDESDGEMPYYERQPQAGGRQEQLLAQMRAQIATTSTLAGVSSPPPAAAANAVSEDMGQASVQLSGEKAALAAGGREITFMAGQRTLDKALPQHAARARELEARSAFEYDDDADSGSEDIFRSSRPAARSVRPAPRLRDPPKSSRQRAADRAAADDPFESIATAPLTTQQRKKRRKPKLKSHPLPQASVAPGIGCFGGRVQSAGMDLFSAFRSSSGAYELSTQEQQREQATQNAQGRKRHMQNKAASRALHLLPGRQDAPSDGDTRKCFSAIAQSSQFAFTPSQPAAPQFHDVRGGTDVDPFKDPGSQQDWSQQPTPPPPRPHWASGIGNGSGILPWGRKSPGRSASRRSQYPLSQGNGDGDDWTGRIVHPAEPTQENRLHKKGWRGLSDRLMSEMNSGEFVEKYRPNPARLLFKVLDGNYDGELFCPVCEVVELIRLPPHPRSDTGSEQVDPARYKLSYSDWGWAQPVRWVYLSVHWHALTP